MMEYYMAQVVDDREKNSNNNNNDNSVIFVFLVWVIGVQ